MSNNICPAQTIQELNFILKKVSEPVTAVPFDLSVHLYCIDNNINYYNPINFIKRDFHTKALVESDLLIRKINFGNLERDSLKKQFCSSIRFKFYSAIFLSELIDNINKKQEINKIFLSGWNKYLDDKSEDCYSLSYLTNKLFKDKNIVELSSAKKIELEKKNYKYSLSDKKKFNKKIVLLNNLGYNFKRILFHSIKNGFNVIVLDQEISFIKRFIFLFLGVSFLKFNKKEAEVINKIKITDINFTSNNKDFSKILTDKKNQELQNIDILNSKCDAIEEFVKLNEISLIMVNLMRGLPGFLAEVGKKHAITSVCISHGTIAKSFNDFDKIYKTNIAEAVFSGRSKYFTLQSKIMKSALKTHRIEGKPIETGNLIFQEGSRKENFFIMFAVTLKSFENLQFLGVEMFYEFLDNLDLFNDLSQKYKLKFLIKLPPNFEKNISLLKKCFKNLKFINSDLRKNLEKCLLTISYSSTVIEDSLHCGVPVILFDRWKRYQHCNSQNDPKTKNSAIYYVTHEKNLLEAIESIKKSDNINFSEYIYQTKSQQNIKNLFSQIIK